MSSTNASPAPSGLHSTRVGVDDLDGQQQAAVSVPVLGRLAIDQRDHEHIGLHAGVLVGNDLAGTSEQITNLPSIQILAQPPDKLHHGLLMDTPRSGAHQQLPVHNLIA